MSPRTSLQQVKEPFSFSEVTYCQEAAEEASRAPRAMAAARTVASERRCSIKVACHAKAAGGSSDEARSYLMGRFFNNVFHQGCCFELTNCITEPPYCTTTDKRRKHANPLNGYICLLKKQVAN